MPIQGKDASTKLTLNVRGKLVSVSPRLLVQMVACLIQALHDSLAKGDPEADASNKRRRVDLETPIGPSTVYLFPHQVGAWKREQRQLFASALRNHWEEIFPPLAQALAAGQPPTTYRLGALCRNFMIGPEVASHAQFALLSLGEFISRRTASDEDAKADAQKIVRHVERDGFPAKAVTISDGRIRVNLLRAAAAAKVSLAAINRSAQIDSLQKDLDRLASRQAWSIGQARYLPTENNPHGHRKELGLIVDFERLKIARRGLLDEILDLFVLPADHHSVGQLVRNVSRLVSTEKGGTSRDRVANAARLALGAPAKELSGQDAVRLVEGLAVRIAGRDMKDRTKCEYLGSFFNRVADAFEQQGFVRPKWRGSSGRPIGSTRRGLISDLPDPLASKPALRPSLVHVAVGSPKVARSKAIEHLDDRLKRIKTACEQEISAFINWREFLERALLGPPDARSLRFKPQIINQPWCQSAEYREWLGRAELESIAHCMISSASELGLFKDSVYAQMRATKQVVRMSEAFPRFCEKFPFVKYWVRSGVRRPWLTWLPLTYWYVPRQVQLAIEIKIQIATAWNRETIRNLRPGGINLKEMELQSIKGKVGEPQHGSLESSDRILRRGLELMLEHDRHVTENWTRECDGIFVAPLRLKGRLVFDRDYEAEVLKRFLKCHGLPKFSREQLRNQKATLTYLKNEDPYEVQGLLGHGDLSVTAGYIKHEILTVLNRANVFAFQRQLAATIVWATEGDKGVRRRAMRRRDINPKLLFPFTDNPVQDDEMPPECDIWMTDTSRTLVIDPIRISHLVRQRAYYAEHWQRLRAENSERFRVVHLPRIEFASALWALVSDSPYAELLEAKT